jgi:hypothetical protein
VLLDLEPGIVYAKAEGLQDCTALHSALSGIQTSGDMEVLALSLSIWAEQFGERAFFRSTFYGL